MDDGRIHYIYKIHFLMGFPAGRYYIGKRTFKGDDISKDKYTGSGNFCFAYFKKYGRIEGKTYIREILEINPSKKINALREIEWIGDKYKNDKLCMNQAPGGLTCYIDNDYTITTSVRQYDLDGNFIKEWDSIVDAESELRINNVGACCAHRRHQAGGFMWRYASDGLLKLDKKEVLPKQARAVRQYSLAGELIAEFDAIRDAVNQTGVDKKSIQECCIGRQKTGKGFIWKYVDPDYIRPCNRDIKVCGAIMVEQYSDNGELINKWESIYQAARGIGVSPATVAKRGKDGKPILGTTLKLVKYA